MLPNKDLVSPRENVAKLLGENYCDVLIYVKLQLFALTDSIYISISYKTKIIWTLSTTQFFYLKKVLFFTIKFSFNNN